MSREARLGGETMANTGGNWEAYVPGSVWFYQPNKIAPPIFAAAYLASGVVHAWQTKHYKSWRITLLIPWGALLMCAGFIMREVGAYNIEDLGILIASIVLLLSGPPVYSGAAYFILARTLYYIPWLSPLHPGRILTTFIGIDFLIELMVANGAAKAANTSISAAEHEAGEILIKIALILQACTFTAYVTILAIWHVRANRANLLTAKLRKVVWVMYASATLITVRCIYRIVEYFQGFTGELYTHEAYFYVFEGVLMLINSVMLNVLHPGTLLPQDSRVYLGLDGVTELKGPGRDGQHDFWNHPQPEPEGDGGNGEEEAGKVESETTATAAVDGNAALPEVREKKRPVLGWFSRRSN
ncbi:hypothetical protein Q7P37_006264 [Cladosporium fusiforme]